MKILIGTAQFDKNYGISRPAGKFNLAQKKKLIKFAQKNKITGIDTAKSYKNAEKQLGQIGVKNFSVVSKLPRLKKNLNIEKQLMFSIKASLQNLQLKSMYAILIHDLNDLNINNREKYLSVLKKIKKINLVKKIGISLYDINDIKKIIKYWKPDLIQIPYNILDRGLNDRSIIRIIKKNKIEIHARSIFLQGLLTKKTNKKKFNRWKKIFSAWFVWCKKQRVEPFEAAYLYVKKNVNIDKIVIGFDNLKQVEDIIKIKKKIKKFPNFKCTDKKLINPSNWSSL